MSEPLPFGPPRAESPPPSFSRIGIVGVGLIGGSLALAIRRRWPASLVIGVDRKDVIERAMVAHAIDVGADDLGMVSEAELIVLAAPVDVNERLLSELDGLVTGEAIVTDVSSTKRSMLAASAALPKRLTFVGGHPIAGAAVAGLEHARPDLFDGRPWVLCPGTGVDPSRLATFLTALGATCVEMSAEQHDRIVAFLSHLPQLTASALMHVVGEGIREEGLALSGRGLQDTTRLASSPAALWKAVATSNADEIRSALDTLIDVLAALRDDLDRGEVLEEVFTSAQAWKAKLSR